MSQYLLQIYTALKTPFLLALSTIYRCLEYHRPEVNRLGREELRLHCGDVEYIPTGLLANLEIATEVSVVSLGQRVVKKRELREPSTNVVYFVSLSNLCYNTPLSRKP